MPLSAIVVRYMAALLIAIVGDARGETINVNATADLFAAYEKIGADSLSNLAPPTGAIVFTAPDQYVTNLVVAALSTEEASGVVQPPGRQLLDLRHQQADALYQLATDAAEAGQLSLAFQWATEAVRENPDHADARRVLGYEERDGTWLTSYGARMADAGKSWHPKFGWLAEADVSRYEAGERLMDRRWISAESDAARRQDIKNGWQVRTDHFLVTTNHSLEAAVELAARLERLHQVWRQLFAGFYYSEREVRALFAGERQPRRQARPFRVYYHKNRDQYAEVLRRRQPRIAETLGIYFDIDREAHFFAGDVATTFRAVPAGSAVVGSTGGPPVATLYHEAVHQLFQESKPAGKRIGEQANFWIVEGVAAYFETLTEHTGGDAGLYYTVGEPTAGRLPGARELLMDDFYVPLAELTRLGKTELQGRPDIAKLYSQSAGLAALLMHGDEGRYREALVRYLEAVYAGRDNAQTLAEATQTSYEELDARYRQFMESLP